MTLVDISILAVVFVSLSIGLARGFIREILSLFSWLAAIWIAYTNAVTGAGYLENHITQLPFRVVIAFAGIFVVSLLLFSIISHLLYRFLAIAGISGIDRSLGMLFGLLRGIVIVALLIVVAAFMDFTSKPWWQESLLVDYFDPVIEMIRVLLPADLANYMVAITN